MKFLTVDLNFTSGNPAEVLLQLLQTMEDIDLPPEQYIMFLQGAIFTSQYLKVLLGNVSNKESLQQLFTLESLIKELIDLEVKTNKEQEDKNPDSVMESILSNMTGGSA